MRGVHDHIVKELAVAFPADLLTLALPHLARQADLSAVGMVPGRERFSEVLRGRRWFPDLVAEVHERSNPSAKALGHLEIEYEYRSRSVVRFRDYNHVLTLDSRLDVHTGVVYLNGGPIGLTSEAYSRRSFGRVPCTFRYHSLGISQVLARQYPARPEPLAWALAVLARPKGLGSRAGLALACLRRIQHERMLDESRRFKLLNFVHTYAKLDADTGPEYWDLLRAAENQEVQEMLVTWADEIRAEGIEKMRDVVMDVMTQRFGDLSERTRRAIAAIKSLDELADLARRALRVDSLEELKIG